MSCKIITQLRSMKYISQSAKITHSCQLHRIQSPLLHMFALGVDWSDTVVILNWNIWSVRSQVWVLFQGSGDSLTKTLDYWLEDHDHYAVIAGPFPQLLTYVCKCHLLWTSAKWHECNFLAEYTGWNVLQYHFSTFSNQWPIMVPWLQTSLTYYYYY